MKLEITQNQVNQLHNLLVKDSITESQKKKIRAILNVNKDENQVLCGVNIEENFAPSENPFTVAKVRGLVNKFNEVGVEFIHSKRGRKSKSSEDLMLFIENLYLQTPPDGSGRWTYQSILEEVNKNKILPKLSFPTFKKILSDMLLRQQDSVVSTLISQATKKASENGYKVGSWMRHETNENVWVAKCKKTGEMCGVCYPPTPQQPLLMFGTCISKRLEDA